MKMGLRKPSVSRSLKARTVGKAKRRVKKAINPFYGKKGVGFVKNPKRAVKSAVYRKTTVGVGDIAKAMTPKKSKSKKANPTKATSKKTEAQKKQKVAAVAAPKKDLQPKPKKEKAPQLPQLVHYPLSGLAAVAFFIFSFMAISSLFHMNLLNFLTCAAVAVGCGIYVNKEAEANKAANEAINTSTESEPAMEDVPTDSGDPSCPSAS